MLLLIPSEGKDILVIRIYKDTIKNTEVGLFKANYVMVEPLKKNLEFSSSSKLQGLIISLSAFLSLEQGMPE